MAKTKGKNQISPPSKTYEQRKDASKESNMLLSVTIALVVAYLAAYCMYFVENGYLPEETPGMVISALKNGDLLFWSAGAWLTGALVGAVTGGIAYFFLNVEFERRFTYEIGKSQGDARPMNKEELKAYTQMYVEKESDDDSLPKNNIIMCMEMRRPINGSVQGNNNVFIVGGSGSGKSFAYVKTNIMQMFGSYVITDPSGELIRSTGKMLTSHGYKIKIFNISDMRHSNCYNPLAYIRDEAGVMMVVETLIKNTSVKDGKDDQFFVSAEKLLYSACIFYLLEFCPDESKKNFATVMNMINMSKVDESDPSSESQLDLLFKPLPPTSMASKEYRSFKQAAGKTLKSIIISCVARLQPFMIPQVITLTGTDEMELEKLGDEKTAIFIITPQADRTYAFLASMLYSQMFETLYYVAEKKGQKTGNEKLDVPVMALMDEFANIGEVPEFPSKLSTMRKYNISASVILQDLAQLKAMYKDEFGSIIANCSSWIFLSGTEQDTLEYFSKHTGNRTIRVRSTGISHGKNKSSSQNYQESQRPVLTEDELSRLDKDQCVVYTQNMRPVIGTKYYATEHPRYEQLGSRDHPENNYVYTEMPAYDTGRLRTDSLLRSKSEAVRIKTEAQISDPKKAKDLRFDGSMKDASNYIQLKPNIEQAALDSQLDQCIEAVARSKEDGDVIRFLQVKNVPQRHLYGLAEKICKIFRLEYFLLFSSNPDIHAKYLFGVCVDMTEMGLLDIVQKENPKSFKRMEKNGIRYAEIVLFSNKYEDFKMRVNMAYAARSGQESADSHRDVMDGSAALISPASETDPMSSYNGGGKGMGDVERPEQNRDSYAQINVKPEREPQTPLIANPDGFLNVEPDIDDPMDGLC